MPETHDFEGRQLEIEDHSQASKRTKALIRKVLFSFCQHSPVALKIKKMKVVLKDHGQDDKTGIIERVRSTGGFSAVSHPAGEAYIDFPANHVDIVLDRGRGVLNFTKASHPKVPEERVADAIMLTFVHEATHILHYEISIHVPVENAAGGRIRELATRFAATSAELQRMGGVEAISVIRQLLFVFIRLLQVEGVARFVDQEASGKIFYNDETLKSTYHQAQQATDSVIDTYARLPQVVNKQELIRLLQILNFFMIHRRSQYLIGEHMAYTIFYIEKGIKLEDLLRMSSFEFIKRYEAAIEKKGMRPIISLTSKNGILDYSQLVSVFAEFVKQFKSHM